MQQPEQSLGVWTQSFFAPGFWWRAILTLGIYALAQRRQNRIVLTTHRLTYRHGNLLSGVEISISLQKITDIDVTMTTVGTLLRYGDISIQSDGSDYPEIVFKGLAHPKKLHDLIFSLQGSAPGAVLQPQAKR